MRNVKKNWCSRGQVSIEIIFAIGIIMLFFSTILYYSFDKGRDNDLHQQIQNNRIICNTLRNGIVEAAILPGMSKEISTGNVRINSPSSLIQINDYPCKIPLRAFGNSSGYNITTAKITNNEKIQI